MNKQDFLKQIKEPLKLRGFNKRNNYWYKKHNDIMICVNLQGSQWNRDDYYIELGLSYCDADASPPTVLQWLCRHRCQGIQGEKNIEPEVLFGELDNLLKTVSTAPKLSSFLEHCNAKKVANQFWF